MTSYFLDYPVHPVYLSLDWNVWTVTSLPPHWCLFHCLLRSTQSPPQHGTGSPHQASVIIQSEARYRQLHDLVYYAQSEFIKVHGR